MAANHSQDWPRRVHATTWYCNLRHVDSSEDPVQFDNEGDWRKHMKDVSLHPDRSKPPSETQLNALAIQNQQTALRDLYVCPFCEDKPKSISILGDRGNPVDTATILVTHIAQHVKSLAFMSLPDIEGDAAEGDSKLKSAEDSSRKRLLRKPDSQQEAPSGASLLETVPLIFDKDEKRTESQAHEETALAVYFDPDFTANLSEENVMPITIAEANKASISIPHTEADFWEFIPPQAVRLSAVDSAFMGWPNHASLSLKRRLTHDNYSIAWICTLEMDLIAAKLMLDEEHERLPETPSDDNVYTLGTIAGHNVVISGSFQSGFSAVATGINHMRRTFPNLKFGLSVGIGGGVPVKTDNGLIRLGDIVVSIPTGGHSGVVQFTRGKVKAVRFERIVALVPPPTLFLNAANDLAAKRARSRTDPVEDNIKRIDTSIRGLWKYKHPGIAKDHLYETNYMHLNPGLPCDNSGCDPSKRVQRSADTEGDDDENEPHIVVHRGTIASGDSVIKDAELRDSLAREHELLCFEMGGAGTVNDFPCIVIRGISDYCDSHKNDEWHGYAAAVAAAYARQLFFHMPVDEVMR